jgi:hypothetical protein
MDVERLVLVCAGEDASEASARSRRCAAAGGRRALMW